MTITYDDKDIHAINFAKWMLALKYFQKDYLSEDRFTLWIGDRATHPTVEELYHFVRSKSISVIVDGKELRGEILIFKIRKEEYGKQPSISYEIQTRAFGEISSTRCTEVLLINELKSAEDRLVEILKKGPQPTILDELTKLGYK